MRPEYFLPAGLVKKFFDRKDHESDGLFSLSKLFKKLLTRFHVSFEDDCCDTDVAADERTSLPVRYNAVEGQLEYYNPDTDTWTATA